MTTKTKPLYDDLYFYAKSTFYVSVVRLHFGCMLHDILGFFFYKSFNV